MNIFQVCEEWNDLIELAINKFMSHYEANGCQAMKSADQVVPSSGEFKNPANPALLQPHIKIEFLLDQLVKFGSFSLTSLHILNFFNFLLLK